MPDLPTFTRIALPYLAEQLEDNEVSDKLQQHGFSQELAEKCVCLIPLAFGRLTLHSAGAETSATYCLITGNRQPLHGLPLKNEPVYQAAMQVGQYDVNNGNWNASLHQLIATRSAEIRACNQLLLRNPAARITDIAFTEPYMILNDYPAASKPWWRFW